MADEAIKESADLQPKHSLLHWATTGQVLLLELCLG